MPAARSFDPNHLVATFAAHFRESKRVFDSGRALFPNGVSQYGRFNNPFPIFVRSAHSQVITTVDGEKLIDFWQGHFANILGHNHPSILERLNLGANDLYLQLGLNTELEQQVATSIAELTGAEQVLLCTTGAQSTMLAVMIGLAHTKRSIVVKIQGGWHGVQPWSLVDVASPPTPGGTIECAGVPTAIANCIVTVPFNDAERLRDVFLKHGNQIGAVISELVIGNSGMEMATLDFAIALRTCTEEYGAVLILDEIVTGFRTSPGPLSAAYGIEPDLATFGKAICGGMPFAAIAGRREVLSSVRTGQLPRVLADAGTFTAHPATLLAVDATLTILRRDSDRIYPRIAANADLLRTGLDELFDEFSIPVHVTGAAPDPLLPSFPIMTVRFLCDPDRYDAKDTYLHWDRRAVDVELRDTFARLALAIRGLFVWQGAGAVTASHTASDVAAVLKAYRDWLQEWQEAN